MVSLKIFNEGALRRNIEEDNEGDQLLTFPNSNGHVVLQSVAYTCSPIEQKGGCRIITVGEKKSVLRWPAFGLFSI